MSQPTFRRIALFGKGAANRDYDWLKGESDIPAGFFGACQYLARTANENGASLSALATLPDGIYLARSFPQGFDMAFRPSFALEVGRISSPRPFEAEHLMGIAWLAAQESWGGESGPGEEVRIEIPKLRDEPAEPGQALTLRARLGLPVSAPDIWQGLALLREFPHRYIGIAFAPQLKSGAVSWNRELALLMAVHFALPPLDAEDSELLAAVASQPPTAEEWQALDQLSTQELRRVLLWAANQDGRFPGAAQGGAAAWLVAYRRCEMQGAPLLARLQVDLGLPALPRDLLARALPGLSAGALDVLAANGAGEAGGPVSTAAFADLAEAGLLTEGSPVSPKVWLSVAPQSEAVAKAGLDLLQAQGVGEGAARWLLGLHPGPGPLDFSQVVLAIVAAGELGHELPFPRLWDLAAQARSLEDLTALGGSLDAFGPQGAALLRLLTSEAIPPAGGLSDEELARGFTLRRRLGGSVDVWSVLKELLKQDRTAEARSVLAAVRRGELCAPHPKTLAVLSARLDERPPVEVDAAECLPSLAQAGLISPGDVVPRGEESAFLEVAAIWPETAPLAAVLRAERVVPLSESCPPGWRTALQQVLKPDRVRRWLAQWRDDDLEKPRLWLCEVLDLPAMVRDGAEGIWSAGGAAELRACWSWFVLLWQADRIECRLEIVAALAARGWLQGEDRRAAELARELLGRVDWELSDLCVHLLSGVGPLPPISRIAPDLLAALAPAADPIPLVNSLFCLRPGIDHPRLIDAVVARVQDAGVSCPSNGYTAGQIERHAPLAHRLACLTGWERVAPDPQIRMRFGGRLLDDLDLPRPPGWGAQENEDRDVID